MGLFNIECHFSQQGLFFQQRYTAGKSGGIDAKNKQVFSDLLFFAIFL